MKELIDRILAEAPLQTHHYHGLAHWKRVAEFGRRIAEAEDLDTRLLELFAYFHDCKRWNEDEDPGHGPRAADYLLEFNPDELGVTPAERERLAFACRHHTDEVPTDDLLVKACWDADRLDLRRVGIIPDPARLFTATARRLAAATNPRIPRRR